MVRAPYITIISVDAVHDDALRIWSSVDRWSPLRKDQYRENVSIWWRHRNNLAVCVVGALKT